jgi:hypothetical protein
MYGAVPSPHRHHAARDQREIVGVDQDLSAKPATDQSRDARAFRATPTRPRLDTCIKHETQNQMKKAPNLSGPSWG